MTDAQSKRKAIPYGQKAFADMTKEELQAIYIQHLNAPSAMAAGNAYAAAQELTRRAHLNPETHNAG